MSPTLTQSEPRLNIPADDLTEAMQWVNKARDVVPPQVALTMNATIWFLQVHAFRIMEEALLDAGKYENSLAEHRKALSVFIAQGEEIVFTAKQMQMEKFPAEFTLADVESTLNSLRIAFRCQHGPRNSDKTNALISQLFDGPQSKN